MQLTFTAWVESPNIRDDGRGKTNRSSQKHEALVTDRLFFTGRHLLDVSFFILLRLTFST